MHTMQLSALDLNLTLVLHALLTERSVARAAKRVGLSPSATSHALARLRAILGDPLVVRTPQGVTPTARAEALVEPLGRALELLEDALLTKPKFDPSAATDRFQLAATDYAELLLLPRLVTTLERLAPRAELWLRPFVGDVLGSIRRGELDASLGVFPPSELAPTELRSRILFEDRFVCVVRKRHPLAGKKRLTVAAYAGARHLLIAPRGRPGGPVDDALAARGHARKVTLAVPHFLAAPSVIAETDLVLTVAERIARLFAKTMPLRILEPPLALPRIRLSMVWHERNDANVAHRWLREQVVAASAR